MKNKLLVYLADLDHFVEGNRISVPLSIALIASYCKNLLGDTIDFKLFKNPEELMQTIERCPPDVLGLSYFMWNSNISLKVIECCKLTNSSIITVLGGPSIARNTDRYKELLNSNPCLDAVVLDQGEKSFFNLINVILSKGMSKVFNESIPGCAFRLKDTKEIVRGEIVADNEDLFNKYPSPYLMGYLDTFLEAGFLPLLETTRGCPYSCTYCGTGDKFFSKLHIKNEELVYKELLYILERQKTGELIMNDCNFGMMGERDKRIALFMADLYKKHKFPFITGYASAKIKQSHQ